MAGGTKNYTYFNKPATKKLQVCLSMYDISLLPGIKGLSVHSISSVAGY